MALARTYYRDRDVFNYGPALSSSEMCDNPLAK